MERGASDLTSPDVSISGFAGPEGASNFIEIDVESALRELGGNQSTPRASDSGSFTGNSAGQGGSQGDCNTPPVAPDHSGSAASDQEMQDGKAPSQESSDSDVIYIDLTQRPPPLPMSGLALEQIVTMLPGSTYSVAGSGVPLRASPRPAEPPQKVASPKAGASDAAHVGGFPTGEPVEDVPADGPSGDAGGSGEDSAGQASAEQAPPPAAQRVSRAGAAGSAAGGGGGGSPRVALTFIPGLGLVPVMIHNDDDDDDINDHEESEQEDEDGFQDDVVDAGAIEAGFGGVGFGMGAMVEELSSNSSVADVLSGPDIEDATVDGDVAEDGAGEDDSVEAAAAAFSSQYDAGGIDSDSGGDSNCEPAATEAKDTCDRTHDASVCFKTVPAAAEEAASGGVSAVVVDALPPLGDGAEDVSGDRYGGGVGPGEPAAGLEKENETVMHSRSGRYDVSEEQLRDIIQQAVRGLEFGELVLEDEEADDEDEEEGEDVEDEHGSGRQDQEAVYDTVQMSGDGSPTGVSELTDGVGGAASVLRSHRSLTAVYAPAAAGGADSGDSDQSEDAVEEDLGGSDEDEEVGVDEVDDSANGGLMEEPRVMLGGLRQQRFMAAGTALRASSPGSLQAAACASADAAAAGSAADAGGRLSGRALEPVRVAPDSDDASVMPSRLEPQAAVLASQFARPRYMSYNVMRSYDGPCLNGPEEAVPSATAAPSGGLSGQLDVNDGSSPGAASEESSHAEFENAADPVGLAPADAVLASKRSLEHNAMSAPVASSFLHRTAAATAPTAATASGSGGGDLNSTMRNTGKSLAAIREAALQAESQRQAKFMSERLGGGASKPSSSANTSEPFPGSLPGGPAARPLTNPFGCAGHEASAAAGLIDIKVGRESSSSARHGGRRGGNNEGGTGTANTGHHNHHHQQKTSALDATGDLEDLLRDRAIIEPRYPTDNKPNKQHQSHHHHQDKHGEAATQHTQPGESTDAADGRSSPDSGAGDSGGAWKPRHRRSVELVDLDKIARGNEEGQQAGASPPTSPGKGSGGGTSPTSPPARSLLATRKSDDGMMPGPVASRSPRLEEEEDEEPVDNSDSSSSSATSSSAHSVADERLVDELEALREELGQKTTLVAGLRGELRKYTELAMKLEHQLGELRHQHTTADGSGPNKAELRSHNQSENDAREAAASAPAQALLSASPAACSSPHKSGDAPAAEGRSSASAGPGQQPPHSQPQSLHPFSPGLPISHGLPPHPQAQGLEAPARLTVYSDILKRVQLQVGKIGGPAPPDLRDAQGLLVGKDQLDAGTEKVLLLKLEKMITWGCEAAWKASVAQQQARFTEQAAQQSAQARSALEAEREQLKQALEAARAGLLPSAAGTGAAGDAALAAAVKELQDQLHLAKDELEASRSQVSDLEEAVASLNADVRKLKVQLRNSRDGATAVLEQDGQRSAATVAADAASSRADSMAWNMERQMLLKTISGLERELEIARAAQPASARGNDGAVVATARKVALAEAALERMQHLQDERDAAAEENLELRRQVKQASAAAAVAVAQGRNSGLRGSGGGAPEREPEQSDELQQLRAELAAAREALEQLAVESQAEVAAHEEQCALLRSQVLELRRELAEGAADAAAAAGRRHEEKRVLAAAERNLDAVVRSLEQQLLAAEEEVQELRAALKEEAAAKALLVEQLQMQRKQEEDASSGSILAPQRDKAPDADEAEQSIEALQAQMREQSQEATATIQALSQALKLATADRDRLQQLVDVRGRELSHAETQLSDVSAAVAQLQAEAAEMQARVAQMQALLERVQLEREDAEGRAAEARMAAEAAEERAVDAHAASLLAETALGRALEEVDALNSRVGVLEDEAEAAQEAAAALQRRAQTAEEELVKVRAEVAELRAYAAELETDTRDLRTALAAEDSLQIQLRGQVECLESELEAQASLAQVRGQRTAEVEAALVVAEGRQARAEAEVEARAARAAMAEAQSQVAELEARLLDMEAQLAEALQRGEDAAQQAADLQVLLEKATDQRQRAENELQDALKKLEASQLPGKPDEQRGRQPLSGSDVGATPETAAKTLAESRLSALEDQLRAAELDREAVRREVAALLKQVGASAQLQLVESAQQPRERQLWQEGHGPAAEGNEAATLRAERALLLADCARLQAELERLRGEDGGSSGAAAVAAASPQGRHVQPVPSSGTSGAKDSVPRAEAEALHEQLRTAQSELHRSRADLHAALSELQGVRGELRTAQSELAAKAELLVAKDRSLGTLQESVEALKLALQVTQQSLQVPLLSPISPAQPRAISEGADSSGQAAQQQQQYQDTVAVLHNKFEESEVTIRRLEKQVAALETRLTPDDNRPRAQGLVVSRDGVAPTDKRHSPAQSSGLDKALAEVRQQLEEKKEENARLLRALELARKELSVVSRAPAESGHAAAAAARVVGAGGAAEAGTTSTATLNDLQMQILQWRALGEDVHARYKSKKEAVRRLREQLAAEQQRHADEQARSTAQLEAACQRLGRLATDLGTALRRCIALDLQPLSTTTLTTSPRTQIGRADASEDINALAALLARQGAALIESLELALDQVTSAREERALLLAQLAHRQVVLDELRHHVARQAAVAHAAGLDAAIPASPSGAAVPSVSSSAPAAQGPTPAPADVTAKAAGGGPAASPSKSLHMAAMNLAQDMAALSAQQAGLRSTLHHFEQRSTAQQGKPRSLGSVPGLSPAGYPASAAVGTAGLGIWSSGRHGAAALATDVPTSSAAGVGGGPAGTQSLFGRLSAVRTEAASPNGGVPLSRPMVAGLYQQPTSPASASLSPHYDSSRLPDTLHAASYLTMSRGLGGNSGGPTAVTSQPPGVLGLRDGPAGGQGSNAVLSLSHERRLKMGESGM